MEYDVSRSLGGEEMCVEESVFFFQAEDGIRSSVASRGLGNVYKRQLKGSGTSPLRTVLGCPCRPPRKGPEVRSSEKRCSEPGATLGSGLFLIHI